jgi:excisionase family DNA binding protein
MIIGVSPFTLRKWLRERRVAYHRCGRRIIIDRDDVERFLRRGRVEAREPNDAA